LQVYVGVFLAIIYCLFKAYRFVSDFFSEKLYKRENWIRYRIQNRIYKAYKKMIPDKIEKIVTYLGTPGGVYEDANLRITARGGDLSVFERAQPMNRTVFSLQTTHYSSTGEETIVETVGSGFGSTQYRVTTRPTGGGATTDIVTYIPGAWEKHIDKLYLRALKEEKKLRKKQKIKELSDEAKKFGL